MNTKVAKKNNKGFTLIELIVVIAIIAVLAAILAPQYLRYVEKSRVTADTSSAKEIANAVQTACADSDVFEDVTADTTVDWAGKTGKITVGTGKTDITTATDTNGQKLAAELGKTIKNVPKMKSKKWQNNNNGTYTITITVNTSDSTVTLKDNAPTGTDTGLAHSAGSTTTTTP